MVFPIILKGDVRVQEGFARVFQIIVALISVIYQKLRLPDPVTKSSTSQRFQLSSVSSFFDAMEGWLSWSKAPDSKSGV
ncbi:MAG TPA: hypothetical protein VK775_15660, partial [Chthoniobacterales bacterium]|nr:hypothetical protein [Chthoniobacterales bacterium]